MENREGRSDHPGSYFNQVGKCIARKPERGRVMWFKFSNFGMDIPGSHVRSERPKWDSCVRIRIGVVTKKFHLPV
jgi:hypothetical protein